MNKKLKTAFCILIAAVLIAGQALAIPLYRRQGDLATPSSQYELASKLAYYIKVLHIDSGLNDDPMLRAYQAVFETEEELNVVSLRRELIAWFREDADNADLFMDTMLWLYDHHSYIFTQEEYNQAYPSSGDYKGIGMTYHIYGTTLWVNELQPGSPAELAGIEQGDRVVAINDRDLRVMTQEEISLYMEQTRGQECTMTVIRGESNEEITFELVPADVEIPNVSHEIIDGVGYLRIERFAAEDFTDGLDAAVADFAAAGVTEVIIDLRDNPGGSVVQLEEALNAFIPEEGKLLFTERSREKTTEHRSTGGGYATEQLYVLIDGGSASSSEIMSGALRDLGLATLVGGHSYGKGRGQGSFYLEDYIVVCSVSEALLPVTGAYDGEGLEPDITTGDGRVYFDYDALGKLAVGSAVSAQSDEGQIEALEARLYLLGYLNVLPDGNFDSHTVEALNQLQEVLGLAKEKSASAALLKTLDGIVETYREAYTLEDSAWEAVWNLIDESKTDAAA